MQNSDFFPKNPKTSESVLSAKKELSADEIFGMIHSVETLGALDGPGLRYVLFLQGCPFSCAYCHNPDTREFGSGYENSVAEQFSDILRYRKYLSGGVTISGGEPLAQPEFVTALLEKCRANHIHGAIDTSGGMPLKESERAIRAADLMLVDIKAFDRETARSLCGVDTTRTWALLDFCEKIGKPVWIRHVLVPGKTIRVRDENNREISGREAFLMLNPILVAGIQRVREYSCVQKIELLPFHKLGTHKWSDLGIPFELADIDEPAEHMIAWCESLIEWIWRGESI